MKIVVMGYLGKISKPPTERSAQKGRPVTVIRQHSRETKKHLRHWR